MVQKYQLVVWGLIPALPLIIYVISVSNLAFLSFRILICKIPGLG